MCNTIGDRSIWWLFAVTLNNAAGHSGVGAGINFWHAHHASRRGIVRLSKQMSDRRALAFMNNVIALIMARVRISGWLLHDEDATAKGGLRRDLHSNFPCPSLSPERKKEALTRVPAA